MIKQTYNVGIYLRLSKDDEKDYESQSISNQRDFIINYLEKNKLTLIDEYIDDGVSGTQFDRAGWLRLINDIETGRINMVVTKDTSRLGRNISQCLYYSTEYFQEKGVRYVAIADGIDTFDKNQNTDMLMFKAFYNEMFVKDISTKIKATLNSQKRNGKFMGSFAPFGYKKNLPYNKHELIIDEEQAEVVKRIYHMFIKGMGIKKIANILTEEKILIPSIQKNLNRGNKSKLYGIWQQKTISDILTNPTYKGDLTQCREYKVSYKSKKRKKNQKENWIIAKGACPAIVDERIFDLVQNMYHKNKNRTLKSNEYLLRGCIFCKECGHSISINKIKWKCKGETKIKNNCYCNYYKKYSKYNVCSPHKFDYDKLEKIILNDLKNKCKKKLKISFFKTILENNNEINKIEIDLKKQIEKYFYSINQQDLFIDKLYKDKLNDIIDEEMFKRQYNNFIIEKNNFKNKLKELENKLIHLKNSNNIKYENIISNCISFENPTKQLISLLIDKIVIDKYKNIDIYYRFKETT